MKDRLRPILHALVMGVTVALFVVVVVPASRIRHARKRRSGEKPAILWGPVPQLMIRYVSRADRLYGYRSDTLVYRVYAINERDDFDIVLDRFTRIPGLGRLVPYAAFLWAGLSYDIFGFFFDGGLLWESPYWMLELPLLRLAGKKIIALPYGGDARLASKVRALDRWNVFLDVPRGQEDRDEVDVRRHLDAFGRWANAILGNNDIVEDLPRHDGVLPYPIDLDRWKPVGLPPDDDVVTVVHASNHRHYKGTRFLIDAVQRLRAEGLRLELDIVEGVPNDEARTRYARAHVIAGDFLIGGYATFAVEGMALGKPVLSYLRPETARYHPEWDGCPVVNASPATLIDELRRLVVDRELREELARRGPDYVRRVHSLEAIGEQMDGIYRRLWNQP